MTTFEQKLAAAKHLEWSGSTCFHMQPDGTFCGKAKRWEGHNRDGKYSTLHKYVSLADLLTQVKLEN